MKMKYSASQEMTLFFAIANGVVRATAFKGARYKEGQSLRIESFPNPTDDELRAVGIEVSE